MSLLGKLAGVALISVPALAVDVISWGGAASRQCNVRPDVAPMAAAEADHAGSTAPIAAKLGAYRAEINGQTVANPCGASMPVADGTGAGSHRILALDPVSTTGITATLTPKTVSTIGTAYRRLNPSSPDTAPDQFITPGPLPHLF